MAARPRRARKLVDGNPPRAARPVSAIPVGTSSLRATARWGSYSKALLATTLWGLSFVAVRIALEGVRPFGLVWMRNALGALVLFGALRARGEPLLPVRGDRLRCTLIGLILGVHFLVQTLALELTTAVRAGWIIAFVPVTVALLSAMLLGRRLSPSGWVGIALSSAGVLVLTSVRPAGLAQAGWGDLMVLSTCFLWASCTLLSLAPMRRSGALRTTAWSMAVAAVPSLLAAAVDGSLREPTPARSVAAVLFLGLGASAVAMWAFNSAVSEIGPERAAAFQYLQPFVTLAGSALLLDEPMTRAMLASGPVVLLGVWLIQRSR
jgi:drug/metabolite transporter (DMT)-like permease